MIRVYRVYRNKDVKDPGNQVGVQLFQIDSIFTWLVFELYAAVLECCHLFHHVPMPKCVADLESDWGCDCDPSKKFPHLVEGCGCWGRFGDYYGDDLGTLWHCYFETPLLHYIYRKSAPVRESMYLKVPISNWDQICLLYTSDAADE